MKINKHVLLLGAGFTKNFGGYLANEMWAKIFTHSGIQRNQTLRNLLLQKRNYEEVYSRVIQKEKYSKQQKDIMADGLESAYQKLDESLQKWGEVRQFALFHFVKQFMGRGDEFGFVFTLNQDLLFERHWPGTPDMALPGLPSPTENRIYINGRDRIRGPFQFSESARQLPNRQQLEKRQIKADLTPLTYIKLHGSHNYASSHSQDQKVMVIGFQKGVQIAAEPLLEAYFELFRETLLSGNIKLMIYGYGFVDPHINSVLKEATTEAGLKSYIINPSDPFDFFDRLKQAKIDIHRFIALSGYFQYRLLDEIFPKPGDLEYAGWKDINDNYFRVA